MYSLSQFIDAKYTLNLVFFFSKLIRLSYINTPKKKKQKSVILYNSRNIWAYSDLTKEQGEVNDKYRYIKSNT